MKQLKDLKIGEWLPTENNEFTVRLDENTHYSSKNQDSIIIIALLLTQIQKLNEIIYQTPETYTEMIAKLKTHGGH